MPAFRAEAVSAPDFFDWQRDARSFERMAFYGHGDATLVHSGQATQVALASVSDDLLTLTGARAALGRLLAKEERNAILITDPAFERLFARDPAIIGKPVMLNGTSMTVTGVLPKDYVFAFPLQAVAIETRTPEVYTLSNLTPQNQIRGRANAIVRAVCSLRPGFSVNQARTELEAIQSRIAQQNSFIS